MKNKKNPGVRITHTPELFMLTVKRRNRSTQYKIVDRKKKSYGVFASEDLARVAAVLIARKYLVVPKDYQDKYQQKLSGYEQLHNDMIGVKDEDTQ